LSYRETQIKESNNPDNPNQNKCAQAVAKWLGVADKVRYLHNVDDLVRASRKKFTVRSRLSEAKKLLPKKKLTVSQFRKIAKDISDKAYGGEVRKAEYYCPDNKKSWVQETRTCYEPAAFIIRTPNHAIGITSKGEVVVDTAPRKSDRRLVTHVYMVCFGEPTKSEIFGGWVEN
tara:strand:- start:475 stop:996 length:522 start_codon:yes stop_codon:yes gene_type:complete